MWQFVTRRPWLIPEIMVVTGRGLGTVRSIGPALFDEINGTTVA